MSEGNKRKEESRQEIDKRKKEGNLQEKEGRKNTKVNMVGVKLTYYTHRARNAMEPHKPARRIYKGRDGDTNQ